MGHDFYQAQILFINSFVLFRGLSFCIAWNRARKTALSGKKKERKHSATQGGTAVDTLRHIIHLLV